MRIIEASKTDLTKKELYLLTMSPEIQKISDVTGQVIEIAAWLKYADLDHTSGEEEPKEQVILSLLSTDGESFATNSPTFIGDFDKMISLFEGDLQKVEVISGTSKNGRQFVTCKYAD